MSEEPFVPEELVSSAMSDVSVRYWEWHDFGRLDVELVVSFGRSDVVLYLCETGDGDVDVRHVELNPDDTE